MSNSELAIFTICSNNYVPMAKILLESARQHHPDADLHLCLADEMVDEPEIYPAGCTISMAHELGIPDFKAFAFRYDVMEFNTALKPFMIRRLLETGYRSVLYFDPDIEIFERLHIVVETLASGASFVLTPHLCQPAEGSAYPDDIGIMRAGVYNLGFLGVGAGEEADRVLRWWSRRLQYQCLNDQPGGIFVDQKFMDLVPGFADGARILRDTTLNVAYWNLSQRALTRHGQSWLVDGRPLGFFHFSGFNFRDLSRLSKYSNGFRDSDISAELHLLMAHYAARLTAEGFGTIPAGSYAYGRFRSGTPVTNLVRQVFREDHAGWQGDPFEGYEEYLSLPSAQAWAGPDATLATNLMVALRTREPWLRENFRPERPGDAPGLADWFVKHARHLVGDERLIDTVAGRLGATARPRRLPPARVSADEPDVDVVGYLRLALGLGEAGRLTLRALDNTGLKVRGVENALNSASSSNDASCDHLLAAESRARVQIFAINADQIGQVIDHLRPVLRADSYRIIMPFWELANLPPPWLGAFDLVDEVWAPTRFIQAMLARSLRKPVIHMPLLLEFDAPPVAPRARFGLPRDTFLFFFAFDYFSFLDRKNPWAVVEAFRRAFRRGGPAGGGAPARVALVIKTLNSEIVPEQGRALRESLAENEDVILIERTLSRTDTLALVAACDAVVSLHRSEGLGLLVAEAMVLGKPVVATDYSGTTELVTPQTGYPVDFKLIPVEEGQYPFAEGQVWADPDLDHAAWCMRQIVRGQGVAVRVAAAQAHVQNAFGLAAVTRRQVERLRLIGVTP